MAFTKRPLTRGAGIKNSSKKNYKDRATTLRKLGILPSGYHVNSLTESQKRGIRRIEQKLKRSDETLQLLKKPDKYLGARVSSKGARALKGKGYATVRTKQGVYFFGERQHAKRIKYRESDKAIIRTFGNRRSYTYPLDDSPGTLRRIERFFSTRRKNQFLTFRVGDNSPFNITLRSLEDFNKYVTQLEEEWRKKFEGQMHNHPGPYLQIVEVTKYKGSHDDESEEET